jgi:protein-L-isoaspartate(D-aspartate) O-methyltransferase
MTPAEDERTALVADILTEVRATASYTGRDHLHPSVIKAIRTVPRHRFVAPELETSAYLDAPLSIGHGQTISQPYIVALMTDLVEVGADARVLEIGTGSGYQAAVLAEIVDEVYSIERVAALANSAARCLQELGYSHVHVRAGDGYQGWPEYAPYDAILVTAAVPEPPTPLLEQLKPGGHLVVPLGQPGTKQELTVITRQADGGFAIRAALPVSFVPFLRGETDL